jgi:replication-associated recombination protein RarA
VIALTEKYRPQTLADIRGHDQVIRCLSSFANQPCPKGFIFAGPPGCGKTSAGLALAREIGVDVDKREWGGLHEIASGEMTAETVRELFRTTMRYSSWHGSGWKLVLANEADNMSEKAAFIWLDVLEHLPTKCVCVFTTNDLDKLPARFRQRCEVHSFKAPIRGLDLQATPAEIAAQLLIDDVWRAELGHNHSPKLADLEGWSEAGNVSFRAVLQSLEPIIRTQREFDAAKPAPPATVPESPRRQFLGQLITQSAGAPERDLEAELAALAGKAVLQ